jgi:phosphomannomutase/phosphoglucomutase
MKINPAIFRAYDIRGIYEQDLTLEAVEHIGKALASRLLRTATSTPTIAIGRDGRLSGKALSDSLCNGILSTGCNVIDIGMVPSPLVYYASKKLSQGNCIAITGSHNPAQYNGLKMVLQNTTLSAESIQQIIAETLAEKYAKGEGKLTKQSLENTYLEEIYTQNKLQKPLKVALDCGNGVTGEIAPKLLTKLGCEVIELFCEIDGHFPNHHPDPSKPENLQDLQNAVLKNNADIGIAYDGDGDRIGVIDSKGNTINADRLLMLYAQYLLQENPKAEILFDVKCSSNLPLWIEKHGGKATMCRTGHSFVKKALQETGAKLAGEMSGHIFFNDCWYGFDDALYSTARLLSILSQSDCSSEALFATLPDSVNTPELNIAFAEGEHIIVMEKIKKNAHFADAKISTLDGIRVDFADGWGLVRPSNTTPVLVLRFEAKDQHSLKKIQQKFKDLLSPYCSNIPF